MFLLAFVEDGQFAVLYLFLYILQKQKVAGSYPLELGLMKRFWKYLLNREVI